MVDMHTRATYRDDGCVIDVENMLNCHGGNLCNEDSSKGISYGWVNANHVKLCVKLVFELHSDSELLHPLLKIPCVADTQCHKHVRRGLGRGLQQC